MLRVCVGGLALAWAIHPVQVATVHYIAQRTELLMGMFYLLTLYALCRALDGGRRGWLGVAIAACALGMASKEVMVTAPVLVLLYDRAFGAGSWREALTRRRLFYAALAATWLLLLPTFSGLGQRAVGFDMGIRWWQYALQETEALSTYLRLVVWPHPLVFDYGAAYFTRLLQAAPFAAVTATALAAVLLAWWRSPALGFGGLAFFVLLAPTSSVVPIVMQPIAESRLYLPLAAGLVALGTMAHLSLGRRARVGGILMLLALLPPTLHRVAIVGDSLQLAAETARQRPQNPRALSNLGQALMVANRLSAALPPLREAVRLDPGLEGPHVNLAALLNALEQPAEALEHALIAERIKPDAWFAHFHAGTALLKLGRVPEAVEQLRVEVALQPGFADAHNVLGAALYRLGQPAEAIPEFEAALRLNPRSAETQQNLASALTQLGRFDAAIALYREAQQMHPADQGIRTNLAIALTKAGRLEEAKREFQAVLRMQPDSPAALDGLRYIEGHLPSP